MPTVFDHTPVLVELARKLHEHFPRADARAVSEYLDARRAYEFAPTPAALDRFITAARVLEVPTLDLD